MNYRLGLCIGALVGLSGCFDAELEAPLCPSQVVVDVTPQDDPQSYARAESAVAVGSLTVGGEPSRGLDVAVQSVRELQLFEEEPCSDFWWGHEAEVVLSLDDGDAVSMALPGIVRWQDGEPTLSLLPGERIGVDAGTQLPYAPPSSWVVVGLEVHGGCGDVLTLHAAIAREACEDPQACVHTTVVEIGTLELPDASGSCRL